MRGTKDITTVVMEITDKSIFLYFPRYCIDTFPLIKVKCLTISESQNILGVHIWI